MHTRHASSEDNPAHESSRFDRAPEGDEPFPRRPPVPDSSDRANAARMPGRHVAMLAIRRDAVLNQWGELNYDAGGFVGRLRRHRRRLALAAVRNKGSSG
jgi:hypothetical protein